MNGHCDKALAALDEEDILLAEHAAVSRRKARAKKEQMDRAVANAIVLAFLLLAGIIIATLTGCMIAKH